MRRVEFAVGLCACLALAACSNGPVSRPTSSRSEPSRGVTASSAPSSSPVPTFSVSVVATPGVAADDFEACHQLFDLPLDTSLPLSLVDSVILAAGLSDDQGSDDGVVTAEAQLRRILNVATADLEGPLTQMISDVGRSAGGAVDVARLRNDRAQLAAICGQFPDLFPSTP